MEAHVGVAVAVLNAYYEVADDGNRWRVDPVADFDPEEAIALASIDYLVTLTSESGDVTLYNGDVLTGTGGTETHVSIADGATVTLSDVDITEIPDDNNNQWSGITCLGDAVIILATETSNNLKGAWGGSGLWVSEGHTLTIRGSGSLNATGTTYSAGIGAGDNSCGNIVFEGGTITATGGKYAPGIGSGGGSDGGSLCGDIIVGEGITRVVATSGSKCPTPIGASSNGSCGKVSIYPTLTDVTRNHTRTLYSEAVAPFVSNNSKLYTLTCKRGGLVMNADGTGLAAGQIRTDAPEEDQRFAIITYKGQQYLFSPSAKKYLRYNGTFSSELDSPITLDGTFADGEYKYMVSIQNDGGTVLTINNNGNIVINGYDTPDNGNRWRIEPVADFNPNDALGIAGAIILTSSSGEVTLHDGDVLTGEGGINTHVTIADGATVTLSGVTIIMHSSIPNNQWAGITCLGDAVIILDEGTKNQLFGGYYHPGLFVPSGKTLTIRGSGYIYVRSVLDAAGIGSGKNGSCGNIIINGGIVEAHGYFGCAGIGSGDSGSCGNITIGEGITSVTATTGTNASPIGSGNNGSCGTVTIATSLIDVTSGNTRKLRAKSLEPYVSNSHQLYTLTCSRGGLVMNADGTGLTSGQKRADAPEEDKHFAIITYMGKQYLFSPSAKKYLRYDGIFVEGLGSPIAFDSNFAQGDYKHMIYITNESGETLTLNNNDGGNIVINSNYNPEVSNLWHIESVAAFDPTEAVRIARTIILHNESRKVTLHDDNTLTGTGGADTHVTIEDGATVTLSDVNITAIPDDRNHQWAGITCLGDAVIILNDGTTNNLKGAWGGSGLWVSEGHTLSIRGSGSLNATGTTYSSGIGAGDNSSGNIIIEGGTVTATGGKYAPGIGSGGGSSGGCSCGDITIGEGVSRVIATSGSECPIPIGASSNGSCGTVTIATSITDVTRNHTRVLYHYQSFVANNYQLYTLTCKRGGLVLNASGTGLATGQTLTNVPEENKLFAIITYEGQQYLYSPKIKMYLRHDGSFVPRLGSPITSDNIFADGDYKFMLSTQNEEGDTLTFNNNRNIVINSYDTPDDGNRWCIEPVAVFDPTEALAIAGLKLQDNSSNSLIIAGHDGLNASVLLIDRTLYKDGRWNTLCLPFSVNDYTNTPLDGATVKTLATTTYNNGTLTMNFEDATGIEAGKPYLVKWDNDEDILTIGSEADWNAFVENGKYGQQTYQGKTVLLTADITVSKTVGNMNYPFSGTFDGNGHTLTFDYFSYAEYAAPFCIVDGATIMNLHVEGTITTSGKFASGIAGYVKGTTTISNCRSSITITSSVNGDGSHGGLVGIIIGGSTTISNCLFNGNLYGYKTKNNGGFVGWTETEKGAQLTIRNSLFAPNSITMTGERTFARARDLNLIDLSTANYYTRTFGTAQGNDANGMTAVELAEALGSEWGVKDGKVLPLRMVNKKTLPMFYGVIIRNVAPTPVTSTDGKVSFVGSYNPVNICSSDNKTQLYLGADNMLRYSSDNMTIGSCRAVFHLPGGIGNSSMGDVNGDGMVSVTDVMLLVNYILGYQDDGFVIENADCNGDGEITVSDVTVLVSSILQSGNQFRIVVNGADGITYGGGGNGPARAGDNNLWDDEEDDSGLNNQ